MAETRTVYSITHLIVIFVRTDIELMPDIRFKPSDYVEVHRPPLRQIVLSVLVTGFVLTLCPLVGVFLSGGQGKNIFLALMGTFLVAAVYFVYLSS